MVRVTRSTSGEFRKRGRSSKGPVAMAPRQPGRPRRPKRLQAASGACRSTDHVFTGTCSASARQAVGRLRARSNSSQSETAGLSSQRDTIRVCDASEQSSQSRTRTISSQSEDRIASRPQRRRSSSHSNYSNSNQSVKQCPTPGCDGNGSLLTRCHSHYTTTNCPLVHKKRSNRRLLLQQLPADDPVQQWSGDLKDRPLNLSHSIRLNLMDQLLLPAGCHGEVKPVLEGDSPAADVLLFKKAMKETGIDNGRDSQVRHVVLGEHQMETWYRAPFPSSLMSACVMHLCQFCLHHFSSMASIKLHALSCPWRHPPGREIYRDKTLSIFEVDGDKCRSYCQNLCVLARQFLRHKTVHYDVELFLFYVMTEYHGNGCHLVGYFSKEKESAQNYNLSCILVLPCYMRQGYGRLLIEFSYLLTKLEGKTGSPERPLSDLGLVSYRSYWRDVILYHMSKLSTGDKLSIKELSQQSGVAADDLVSTMQRLAIVKYSRGCHVVVRDQELLNKFQSQSDCSRRCLYRSCMHY